MCIKEFIGTEVVVFRYHVILRLTVFFRLKTANFSCFFSQYDLYQYKLLFWLDSDDLILLCNNLCLLIIPSALR